MARRPLPHLRALLLTLLLAGCGEDVTGPDPDVAFLVGDWEAESFLVRHRAHPEIEAELIGLGAIFTVNVQPSGLYTAVLIYEGMDFTELGRLEVEGSEIVFHRTVPSASVARSAWSGQGDRIRLEGPTEFDFNLDGTAESADAVIDLRRR